MGGVINAAAHLAIDSFPKADAGELLSKTFTTLESGMRRTEAGNDMADLLKSGIPYYHAAREKLFKAAAAAGYQHAPHEIDSQARNMYRNHVLGANDYRGVGLIKAIENDPTINPLQKHLEQQNLADHVHMFLKDTEETADHRDISGLKKWQQKAINAKTNIGPQSKFKLNVKNAKENAVRIDSAAIFKPAGDTERWFTRVANKVMLPAIVIPHIGTLFNTTLGTPTQDMIKGLFDATFNNSNIRQFNVDSGIFASTIAEAYAVRHYGERGIIARATGKSQLGVIFNQLTHQPGFNSLREWTLSINAATGHHMAERLSSEFAQSGGKDLAAGFQLKRMGLDTAEILNQKGILNPDQMRKAIFNYVDNKAFLDNTMKRSFNSSRNWQMRLGNLYHGYVTRQGQLIAQTLKDDIFKHKGGLANAAQSLAMLGIVFPTVGTGLETLERWGRGQHENTKEDFENLIGKNGGRKMLEQYIEGYAHMAAFGVATGYIKATTRHKLANQLIGPIGNEGVNLIEDTSALGYSMYEHPDEPEKYKWKPLARDATEDTMPLNLGKLIAHQFIPTAKEEKESNPSHKLKKLKGVGSKMKKLKGVQ